MAALNFFDVLFYGVDMVPGFCTSRRAYDADDKTCDVFHDGVEDGLEADAISRMRRLYGSNVIEIAVLPIHRLIFKEISNLFYWFQLYTIIVWMAQGSVHHVRVALRRTRFFFCSFLFCLS